MRTAVSLDDLVSSRLVITEVPRAIRHKAALDRRIDLASTLRKVDVVLDAITLHPIARLALWRAGRVFEPHLRSLDVIHMMTALETRPIEAFVTYDIRQARAAYDAGLPVSAPGRLPS